VVWRVAELIFVDKEKEERVELATSFWRAASMREWELRKGVYERMSVLGLWGCARAAERVSVV